MPLPLRRRLDRIGDNDVKSEDVGNLSGLHVMPLGLLRDSSIFRRSGDLFVLLKASRTAERVASEDRQIGRAAESVLSSRVEVVFWS